MRAVFVDLLPNCIFLKKISKLHLLSHSFSLTDRVAHTTCKTETTQHKTKCYCYCSFMLLFNVYLDFYLKTLLFILTVRLCVLVYVVMYLSDYVMTYDYIYCDVIR